MSAPAPTSVTRSYRWEFEWHRPQRMGWPAIRQPRLLGDGGTMAPTKVRVTITRFEEGSPKVEMISVRGYWTGSRRPFGWKRLSFNDATADDLTAVAPDWVMEMATEAQRLSEAGPS